MTFNVLDATALAAHAPKAVLKIAMNALMVFIWMKIIFAVAIKDIYNFN